MKKLLGSLGFFTVYNECEDFYALINDCRIPTHDVLATSPAPADAHLQRLLNFCSTLDKPYFLLVQFLPSLK